VKDPNGEDGGQDGGPEIRGGGGHLCFQRSPKWMTPRLLPLVTRHTKAYSQQQAEAGLLTCCETGIDRPVMKNTPPRTASTEATHQRADEYGSMIQPRRCCCVSITRPTGLSSSWSVQPLPSTSQLLNCSLRCGNWFWVGGQARLPVASSLCRKTHRNFFSKHVQREQSRRAGRRVGHGTRPTHDLDGNHHCQ